MPKMPSFASHQSAEEFNTQLALQDAFLYRVTRHPALMVDASVERFLTAESLNVWFELCWSGRHASD